MFIAFGSATSEEDQEFPLKKDCICGEEFSIAPGFWYSKPCSDGRRSLAFEIPARRMTAREEKTAANEGMAIWWCVVEC